MTFGSTATAANADDTYSFDNVNKVTGKLAAKTLTLAGDMLVNQGGTVEKLSTLSGQTVDVGNSASAGSLSVGELAAGDIYAAPTWKEDGSAAAVSLVAVKKKAVKKAVADTGVVGRLAALRSFLSVRMTSPPVRPLRQDGLHARQDGCRQEGVFDQYQDR